MVEDGRYDEAAGALSEVRTGGVALDAALELCHACADERTAARVHREAALTAQGRERRLRERVTTILLALDARAPHRPARQAAARPPRTLAVHALGPLRVFRDGRELPPWSNRRSRSLLKYLLFHRDRPVPKEVLMDLWWPEAGERAARNNLNVAVHGLRRALRVDADEPTCVVFEDDAYRLHPDLDVWVDADEFEFLVGAARRSHRAGDRESAARDHEAALDLYAGDLFAADPYEEWSLPRIRSLQDDYLRALVAFADARLDDGDREGAEDAYRRALAADPCREEAHRGLMRCYVAARERALALRQYRLCESTLASTLGLGPGPETAALHERIRLDLGGQANRPLTTA
jgi:DNA-binding SARP family transcriptional activator